MYLSPLKKIFFLSFIIAIPFKALAGNIQNYIGTYKAENGRNVQILEFKKGIKVLTEDLRLYLVKKDGQNFYQTKELSNFYENEPVFWGYFLNNKFIVTSFELNEKTNYLFKTYEFSSHANNKIVKLTRTTGDEGFDSRSNYKIKDFYGTYVGTAHQIDGDNLRDLDVIIKPYKKGKGYSIEWVTVMYKTARDKPGVRRNNHHIHYAPVSKNLFRPEMKRNPFSVSEKKSYYEGRPITWSRLSGNSLNVYSFFIDKDGQHYFQNYSRALTENGLDISYTSLKNCCIHKQFEGSMIKVEN